MQPNSHAHAAEASASSSTTTSKGPSGKPGAPHQQSHQQPMYQVKGSSAAAATNPLMAQGGLLGQGMMPNAPLEPKLGNQAEMFRPLGALPGQPALGDALGGIASSTSPSPGALFAEPLFKGLPQLPDGSPEDPAVLLSSSAKLGGTLGQPLGQAPSLGGGAPGLLFGPLGGQPGASIQDSSASQENAASANLRAGQISTGFLPLGGGSSGKLGGPPPLLGFGSVSSIGNDPPQAGECITGTYATYHGPIDLMVPRIAQDFDKSLDTLSDLNISKSKKFRSKAEPERTLLVFLAQNARNLSFVINQDDLCDNVLSVSVMEQLGFKKDGAGGVDLGIIHDFTLVDFQYLIVLMSQGHFVVFDCLMVLEGSARQLRYVNQDQIKPVNQPSQQDGSQAQQPSNGSKTENQLTRIEVMETQTDFKGSGTQRSVLGSAQDSTGAGSSGSEPRRVLVFGKQAHRMLCLEFPRSDSPDMDMMDHPQQVDLQIPVNLENRPVLDIAVMEDTKQVAILFGDNMLTIFDLAARTAIFRTKYNDATDSISQLFYVAPRHIETPPGAPLNQSSQPTNETTLLSFLLLVETKLVQKDTPKTKKGGEQQVSVSRAKHLRKLHLVQVQQQLVTSRSKIEKRDKIEQIDALTFGEETPKLVEFVKCLNRYGVPNYFAFLLTRDRVKSNGALKLITVKMRWAPTEEQPKADDNSFDQEEESKAQTKPQARDDHKWKLKFDYVTSLGPKIENFRSDKQKPTYLDVIEAIEPVDQDESGGETGQNDGQDTPSEEPVVFYIYTGVGSQSVVFKRTYGELAQVHPDEATQRQAIEEARALTSGQANAGKKGKKKTQSNYDEMLERMNREQQRDKEQLKAQLSKNPSDPADNDQDPAILSSSQPAAGSKLLQNPEQQTLGQEMYKKKAPANDLKKERPSSAKKTRPGSAKRSRPGSVKRGSNANMQTPQQPMYKTKAKQASPQEAGNDAPGGQNGAATEAQPASMFAKQQKTGAKNIAKEPASSPRTSLTSPNLAQQSSNPGAASTDPAITVTTKVTVPPTKKQQQEQIIENYQELNKKFSELHMKMNSLQQQVKAQKDLQCQVEQTIAKAVKTALPEIVKKQVEETVQPLMQKQQELLDLQVRQQLLPKIEALGKIASQASHGIAPGGQPIQIDPSQGSVAFTGANDATIRRVIQQEFKQAMTKEIIPGLEHELKQMLTKVKDPIINVNKVFYEKLVLEEQKNDHMVQVFEQRLHMAQQLAQQQMQPQIQAAFLPQQLQQPGLHQSFSLLPQAQQAQYQPIALVQQPSQQFQVQVPPQAINQQQLFNVSLDTSLANNANPQPSAQIIPLQHQQSQQQQQQPGTFHPQPLSSFNMGQQQIQQQQQQPLQQPHFVHQASITSQGPHQQAQVPQAQQQPGAMVPQVMHILQPAPHMQSQQLQPTNTNFVPTLQPQQQQALQQAQNQQQQPQMQQQQPLQQIQQQQPLQQFVPIMQPQLSVSSNTAGGVHPVPAANQMTNQASSSQPGAGSATGPNLMQQNVSAPTFTPQATSFQPSNPVSAAQMIRPAGLNAATTAPSYIAKPLVNPQTSNAFSAAASSSTTVPKPAAETTSTPAEPKPPAGEQETAEVKSNQSQPLEPAAAESSPKSTEETKNEEDDDKSKPADGDAPNTDM